MCIITISLFSSSPYGSTRCTGQCFESHPWPGSLYGSPVAPRDGEFSHPSESHEKTASRHEQHLLVGLPNRHGIRALHSDRIHPYFKGRPLRDESKHSSKKWVIRFPFSVHRLGSEFAQDSPEPGFVSWNQILWEKAYGLTSMSSLLDPWAWWIRLFVYTVLIGNERSWYGFYHTC